MPTGNTGRCWTCDIGDRKQQQSSNVADEVQRLMERHSVKWRRVRKV